MWQCTRRFWPRLKEALDPGPRLCTECGEPARMQVTGFTVADIHLPLEGAEPRCKGHARVLLRHM